MQIILTDLSPQLCDQWRAAFAEVQGVQVQQGQMRFAYDLWSGPPTRPTWNIPSEREWRSYGRTREEFLRHGFQMERL